MFLRPLRRLSESGLQAARRYILSGGQFQVRLEALRHRFRLNPPEIDDSSTQPDAVIVRIVCSDGLIGLDS